MINKDLVCYERFEENADKDEDERFDDDDDVKEDAVANKQVCRPSSPVWHLKWRFINIIRTLQARQADRR